MRDIHPYSPPPYHVSSTFRRLVCLVQHSSSGHSPATEVATCMDLGICLAVEFHCPSVRHSFDHEEWCDLNQTLHDINISLWHATCIIRCYGSTRRSNLVLAYPRIKTAVPRISNRSPLEYVSRRLSSDSRIRNLFRLVLVEDLEAATRSKEKNIKT